MPWRSTFFPYTTLFRSTVETVKVMRDMATGRARGFAFVEMSTDEEAQKAITELNEYQLGGRGLTVNEARPKRSEEHTSELQSHSDLVCRLLPEKKNNWT